MTFCSISLFILTFITIFHAIEPFFDLVCSDRDLLDCNDGKHCITTEQRCNCEKDCPSGSDEFGCSSDSTTFRCAKSLECIPISKQCDCWVDCADGSDEKNCQNVRSRPECLKCGDGTTYPPKMRCNCVSDCADGSDEKNCKGDPLNQRFECKDGSGCVTLPHVCDDCSGDDSCFTGNIKNCADQSDESVAQCGEKIECYSCTTYATANDLRNRGCITGAFDKDLGPDNRFTKVKCPGFCATRRTVKVENNGLRSVSLFERGCAPFPIDANAIEKCYDLKNSEHIKELSPDRSVHTMTLTSRKDEVTICSTPLCNGEASDLTRYCVQPGREKGIGKLAAQILSSAPQISPGQLMFLMLLLV